MSDGGEPVAFVGRGVDLRGERFAPADGEERGEPVILLHGGGQTRHSWGRTARRIAGLGRVAVSLDARGHGDSQWDPEGDYSLAAFVADVVAVLEELGRPAVLVGASLGGITSLRVAGEHPDLVSGLVLVDVVVKVEPEGVKRITDFMTSAPDGYPSLDAVADAIAAYNPLRPRPQNVDGLRKNVRQWDDGRWHWHWDPAFMRIDNEPQRGFDQERLAAAARKIVCPTLIVRGAQSDVLSDAGVEDMISLIPHARVVEVAGAGHMVAGDDNDVFGNALQKFLEEVG
jgi:pimeloyl-ACP methyl ester carboxylesterase